MLTIGLSTRWTGGARPLPNAICALNNFTPLEPHIPHFAVIRVKVSWGVKLPDKPHSRQTVGFSRAYTEGGSGAPKENSALNSNRLYEPHFLHLAITSAPRPEPYLTLLPPRTTSTCIWHEGVLDVKWIEYLCGNRIVPAKPHAGSDGMLAPQESELPDKSCLD
jgi:hypothetical protein